MIYISKYFPKHTVQNMYNELITLGYEKTFFKCLTFFDRRGGRVLNTGSSVKLE
jgi:hypothetical protein